MSNFDFDSFKRQNFSVKVSGAPGHYTAEGGWVCNRCGQGHIIALTRHAKNVHGDDVPDLPGRWDEHSDESGVALNREHPAAP